MLEEGEAIGNWDTWIPTASLIGPKPELEMKSPSNAAEWLANITSLGPLPVPSPKAPYTSGRTQTSFPLELPFSGQTPCARVVQAAKKHNTNAPMRTRFSMTRHLCLEDAGLCNPKLRPSYVGRGSSQQ